MTLTTERPGKEPRPRKEPKAPKEPREPKTKAPRPPKEPKARKEKAPRDPKAPREHAAPKEAAWPSPVRPSAMLLPPKVAGRRLHQRAVKHSLIAGTAALALLGLIYIPVAATASAAQDKLDEQQSQVSDHKNYLSSTETAQKYFDGFIIRRQAVADALVKDVAYSAVLKAMNDANKYGISITDAHATKSVKPVTGQPFAASKAVGYLEVNGTASDEHAVSQYIGALADNTTLLTDPYLSKSAVSRDGTTFSLTVGYTDKAMSFKGESFRPSDQEIASLDPDTVKAMTPKTPAAGAASASSATSLKDVSK